MATEYSASHQNLLQENPSLVNLFLEQTESQRQKLVLSLIKLFYPERLEIDVDAQDAVLQQIYQDLNKLDVAKRQEWLLFLASFLSEIEFTVNFPTPTDYEGEDYLHRIEQIPLFQNSSTKFLSLQRYCDGCNCQLHIRQTNLDFKCQFCNIKFDLCLICQAKLDHNYCPRGYGCTKNH